MITLQQTSEEIRQDPKWWGVHLMKFVDSFRSCKDLQAVADPFTHTDERIDALLASTAEALCDELGIEPPQWLADIPACHDPYFVSGIENLKAITIVESPLRFRMRKLFVLENFLSRV
ncbi:MAG TPA: hypothetical protein VKC61_18840 [Pyrinomonadaceae bacterium]|nr:hypothetical protein [Pyrinomonadaceae bacterium]